MVNGLNKAKAPTTNIWAFLQVAPYLNNPSEKIGIELAKRFGISKDTFFVLIKISRSNGRTNFN